MLIVADTSALIALATCDGLPWLEQLFGRLSVPRAVFDEATEDGKPQASKLKHYLSDKIIDTDLEGLVIAAPGLGEGELMAMALYRQQAANYLLIDDLRARKVAQYNGMHIIGSIGVLVLAKNKQLIPEIKPYLHTIEHSEVYISDALIQQALKMAGEN